MSKLVLEIDLDSHDGSPRGVAITMMQVANEVSGFGADLRTARTNKKGIESRIKMEGLDENEDAPTYKQVVIDLYVSDEPMAAPQLDESNTDETVTIGYGPQA